MIPAGEVLRDGEGTKFPLNRVLRERALELLRSWATDAVLPYEAIDAAMEADVQNDRRARRAFLLASRDLLRNDRRKVENVRGVGYRIVRDDERRRVAKTQERAAAKRLKGALETLTHVALDQLPPAEVALLLTDQARVAIQLSIRKRLQKQKELPPKSEISVPKGNALVAMFKRKREE